MVPGKLPSGKVLPDDCRIKKGRKSIFYHSQKDETPLFLFQMLQPEMRPHGRNNEKSLSANHRAAV
jgi:hypothetical protein